MLNKYELFSQELEKSVSAFSLWDNTQPIKVVSHLDADGITACAILINVLGRENRKYSISILPQLDKLKIEELAGEPENFFIFTDFGSGQLEALSALKDKQILILDHHEPEKAAIADNIIHVNPHVFGIDGSKEISGAGVVYLFVSKLNKKYEDLAHLAIIGAVGDVQDDSGFLFLNQQILKTAVAKGKLEVKKGLKLFGMQTRPLHKVLEYSNIIPGVSGSESKAIQFMLQLGINPKDGNDWKKAQDLTEQEMQSLVAGIIMKRIGEKKPDDVLCDIYTLPNEKEGPTKEVKEFATLLNACGRMERASCGIGACLGIDKDRQMALQTLADYRKQIVSALNWYENNKSSVAKGDGYIIINAKDNVPPTIIGTLASILSKSGNAEKTYIMSLARSKNNNTKVSLRLKGTENTDLREIIRKIVAKTGGEAGGHAYAAGALIPTAIEDNFIEEAKKEFQDQK